MWWTVDDSLIARTSFGGLLGEVKSRVALDEAVSLVVEYPAALVRLRPATGIIRTVGESRDIRWPALPMFQSYSCTDAPGFDLLRDG